MHPTFRPNVKLILAAICVIAGVVILWRSFASTPDSVAGVVPPTLIELDLTAPPLQLDPTVAEVSPTIPALATPIPPTPLLPTAILPATQLLPTPITPSAVAPNPDGSTAPPSVTAPGAIATQVAAPTVAIPPTVVSNRATITPTPPTQALATQVGATAVLTPVTTSAPTTIPTSASGVATFTAIVPTQTPLPTAIPVSTSTPANIPTSVPTSTPLLTTVTPTTNTVTVVYRVEGAASKVIISYLDANGKEVRLPDTTLPWRVQFSATSDADLAVDAFGTNNESVALSCAIDVNGTTILTDQTQDAVSGVACEKFPP